MPDAMTMIPGRLAFRRDRRVDGCRLPVAAMVGIGERRIAFAVVGIDDMAARAARVAIVARLVIGAHEPHERIVEARLVDVEHRNGDADAGAWPAIGLLEIGPPRLLEPLDLPQRIGQADLGEIGVHIAPAAFEHAEDVAWRNDVPARQRIERRKRATRRLLVGQLAGRPAGRPGADELGGLARRRIGLAEHVVLERHDAVIVGGPAPQHRTRCHERTLCRLDHLHVA